MRILLFCLTLLTLAAPLYASPAHSFEGRQQPEDSFTSIDVAVLQTRLKSKSPPLLVDVRPADAFAAGHIDGALSMPLTDLPQLYANLPQDRDIVVYCRSGNTSRTASALLHEKGYTKVVNLLGGYRAWSSEVAAKP